MEYCIVCILGYVSDCVFVWFRWTIRFIKTQYSFFNDVMKMEPSRIHVPVILAIVTLCVTSTLVYALLSTSKTIPNTGNVKAVGVGVYSDSACSQQVSIIQWGTLDAGETKNVPVYVRNEGNVNLTLSMTTNNWNPQEASSYITLNWNRGGHKLTPGSSVQAVLTLIVSSTVTGVTNFSFDIIITGTETT